MASLGPETSASIVAVPSRGPAVRWRSSRHQRLDDGFIQGEAMALDHAPGKLHGESPARSCQRRGDVLVGVTATHKEAPTGDGDGTVFCDEADPCDAASGLEARCPLLSAADLRPNVSDVLAVLASTMTCREPGKRLKMCPDHTPRAVGISLALPKNLSYAI